MRSLTPLKTGDWVWYPGILSGPLRRSEGVGQVRSVSGDGIAPCPCCGLGVTVAPQNDANTRLGFAPGEIVRLDREPSTAVPFTFASSRRRYVS